MKSSHTPYETLPDPTSPREIESWALMKSARDLDLTSRGSDDGAYREALRRNLLLWTIIQTDVASDASPLPTELKANILRLSLVVDKRTFAALGDLDRAKATLLIEINRNIALGLMGRPEGAPEQSPPAGPGAVSYSA